jgi:hypothetical protein
LQESNSKIVDFLYKQNIIVEKLKLIASKKVEIDRLPVFNNSKM